MLEVPSPGPTGVVPHWHGRSASSANGDEPITTTSWVSRERGWDAMEEAMAFLSAPVDMARGAKDQVAHVAEELCCNAKRPKCRGCKKSWRWPRNIAYMNMHGDVPKHIAPSTQLCVVAHLNALPHTSQPTINPRIFRRLELTATHSTLLKPMGKDRLIEEFEYNKLSGDVWSVDDERSDPQEERAYARLVNLPSWYITLLRQMVDVGLSIMDHYSNAILAIVMVLAPPKWMQATSHVGYMFAGGWALMMFCCLMVAVRAAQVEWAVKASQRVGDLSIPCGAWDRALAFGALVFFSFFAVENQIKDIPIILHPWKSIQPYAAMKCEGSRCYVVGYMDRPLFMVENRSGQYWTMLVIMCLKTFIFGAKVWFTYVCLDNGEPSASVNLLVSCFSSFPSILIGWLNWNQLRYYRSQLYGKLLAMSEEEHEEEAEDSAAPLSKEAKEERGELKKRQKDAAQKLMTLHFGTSSKQKKGVDKVEKVQVSSSVAHDDLCSKCGRDAGQIESSSTPLSTGCKVMLSTTFQNVHDAKDGPLSPFDVGQVDAVGPLIEGIGYRYLVKRVEAGGEVDANPMAGWWYDESAIQSIPEPEDAFIKPFPAARDSLGGGEFAEGDERVPLVGTERLGGLLRA